MLLSYPVREHYKNSNARLLVMQKRLRPTAWPFWPPFLPLVFWNEFFPFGTSSRKHWGLTVEVSCRQSALSIWRRRMNVVEGLQTVATRTFENNSLVLLRSGRTWPRKCDGGSQNLKIDATRTRQRWASCSRQKHRT